MTSTTINPPGKLNKYGYNCIARNLFFPVFLGALVFAGAGTTEWTWGWTFSIVYFLAWLGLTLALVRWNPEVLNERGKPTKQMVAGGTKNWDWWLLTAYGVLVLLQPLMAGIDYRNQWSGPTPPLIAILGDAGMAAGMALLAWSMVHNRFFENTVRLQGERGHQVISSGPYQYVRHPGYSAVLLMFIALPAALGSWMALMPGILGVAVFFIRTSLEDGVLQAELSGYQAYAGRVRYRLIPGLW